MNKNSNRISMYKSVYVFKRMRTSLCMYSAHVQVCVDILSDCAMFSAYV